MDGHLLDALPSVQFAVGSVAVMVDYLFFEFVIFLRVSTLRGDSKTRPELVERILGQFLFYNKVLRTRAMSMPRIRDMI